MKQLWTRCLLFGLVLFANMVLANSAQAQRSPTVSVGLNTGIAKIGEAVAIIVTVKGTTNGEVGVLPEVEGLILGPASAAQKRSTTSFVNGRVTETLSISWVIPVRAEREGDFEIPAFHILSGGLTFESLPLHIQFRKDLEGEELGIMRMETVPAKIVVGQPFELVMTFGWDTAIGDKVTYANLSLPWWGQLPGAIEIPGGGARDLGRDYVQVQLNQKVLVEVERLGSVQQASRTFQMFQLRRSFLATTSGTARIPTSHLSFGKRQSVGIFASSTPEKMYFVAADPLDLLVGTIPEEGRPSAFMDAVGSISVRAEVDSREVNAGDSIKLRLEWTGDGNLEFFSLPKLAHMEGLEGINFYGATDEIKERDRRVSVFDLAPQSESVTEIPPISLVYYNPASESFETVSSKAIPIRVHALKGTGSLEEEGESEAAEDIRDIRTGVLPSGSGGRLPDTNFPVKAGGAMGGVLLVWLGLRRQVRKRGDPSAPLERRRRAARRVLGRALGAAQTSQERLDAFGAFLSARSGEGDNAWIGRDLRVSSQDRDGEKLEQLAGILDGLDRAIWASDVTTGASDGDLMALARSLEAVDLERLAESLQGGV